MKRKGFTLVELMIAIVILGILAAIVVPVIAEKINDAKDRDIKAHYFKTRQFEQAMGKDLNPAQKGIDVIEAFQDYVKSNYKLPLHRATPEHATHFLLRGEGLHITSDDIYVTEQWKFEYAVLWGFFDTRGYDPDGIRWGKNYDNPYIIKIEFRNINDVNLSEEM